MAVYYLDTSALVKLYVREPDTEHLLRLAGNVGNKFNILGLTQVEFRSALRRRERAGGIDSKIISLILDRFQIHLQTRILIQPLTDSVLNLACDLVDRYALRAYDAIQLAASLSLKITFPNEPITFVCSDNKLLQAAIAESNLRYQPTLMVGAQAVRCSFQTFPTLE